jgi:uncharacterized phiE125 gp8 family phage protein
MHFIYPIMPVAWKVTVAPASLPVTLDEFKAHARIDEDYQDALILQYLASATEQTEIESERAFISRDVDVWYPCWGRRFRLPRSPLIEIDGVFYTDINGDEQTVDSADYAALVQMEPPSIELGERYTYPGLASTAMPVKISAVLGYGSAVDVPPQAKQAIMLMAAHHYEIREPIIVGTTAQPIARTFRSLIESIRVPSMS